MIDITFICVVGILSFGFPQIRVWFCALGVVKS